MKIETAWVKPPLQVGGLDHLAVQAPCINVYGRLLPGITNVTDRARYYSLYPWLIWAFDRRGWTGYDDRFVSRFRSADCLFSLIALRHAAVAGGAYEDHAGAMVGSNTLGPVVREIESGATLVLSDYSKRSGAKARYFASKLGGLGQYYLGALRELGILDGDAANGLKYTRQRGQVIAERVGAGVDGELFLDLLERDSVTIAELDGLVAFCPCRLHENPGEQEILRDLFFATGLFDDPEMLPRRRSLCSFLQLADQLASEEHELTQSMFRACAYSGALPSGKPWTVPGSLRLNRQRWAIYARNELLSLAVQGMFFALLDAYEESALRLNSSADVVRWFLQQPEAHDALKDVGSDSTFSELTGDAPSWLAPLGTWVEARHEIRMADEIVRLCRQPRSAEQRQRILGLALRTLVALAARPETAGVGYGELVFDDGYFRYYRINLGSFDGHAHGMWGSFTAHELLEWLLREWGLETHLRVGLRKLRSQSRSTFRIRPSDRGFEVIGAPPAVHTSPRFNQALRILKDVGALVPSETGRWVSSDFGRQMIGQGDAS